MSTERWQRVEQALDAALGADPAQWQTILDQVCGSDQELRDEVESLLGRFRTARSFLESPPVLSAAALVIEAIESETDAEGRRIGAYRLMRQIGRGGMSRVFLAERADGQYTQHVALKLLSPGLDSDIDHARFRAERQILASLGHPNIARLLDGGVTEEGQPYLVLEHVNGQPIDSFCDSLALTIAQRLELFLTVCDATQYAHRRLIVHRDLKPSNVLVSIDGAVKLLDFGLAKLIEPRAHIDGQLLTPTRQRWMTPEYAAPEQVLGQPVTTLTDVYQLGMVLYQLLAGRLPFLQAGESLRALEDAVLRDEPTPPSTIVSALRGDLDAIVLKAIRKEPEERYASVEALADDVRRHLAAHPVQARRQSAAYRARRLFRRRRVETLAVASIALMLIAGVAFSLAQGRRAVAERDRAEAASRESEAVTDFLLGLFEANDPAETRTDSLTARDLLQRGVARAEQLRGQPAVQARMLETSGRIFQSLGQYASGQALIERSLALRRSAGGADDLEVVGTLHHVADGLLRLGRIAAADSAARQALAVQERVLGPNDASLAVTLHKIGGLAVYRGDLAAAEAYHRRGLKVRQHALGRADSLTATSHLSVGSILQRRGHLAEAEREYRRAFEIYETTLGPDHTQVAQTILHIAYLLADDEARASDAEPLYRRALEIRRHVYGDGHPWVGHTLSDFSEYLSRRGDHTAAIAMSRQYVDILRRAYGDDHSAVAHAIGRLADRLYRAGELDEAEIRFQDATEMERRARGADHANVAGHKVGYARVLIERGKYAAADTALRDALRIAVRVGGPDHPNTVGPRALLGILLTRKGNYAAADSVLQHALRIMESQTSREHPDVRNVYGSLADLYEAWARRVEAAHYRAIATGADE